MAQKILRSSSIKRMRMKFIRSQEPISATKRKLDSDLKRFKGAHGLLYEQELGLQATIFDI